MIKGLHAMFYTPQAEALRVFIRDKLDLPYTDTGGGWLIFDAPEAEIGCHPAETASHNISFYCDDIHQTVKELKARGVEFSTEISPSEFGWVTSFWMPGDLEVDLYQPNYSKGR